MSTGAFFRDDEGRVCAHVTNFGSSLSCQMECLPNPLGFISHVHVGKKNIGEEIERSAYLLQIWAFLPVEPVPTGLLLTNNQGVTPDILGGV